METYGAYVTANANVTGLWVRDWDDLPPEEQRIWDYVQRHMAALYRYRYFPSSSFLFPPIQREPLKEIINEVIKP